MAPCQVAPAWFAGAVSQGDCASLGCGESIVVLSITLLVTEPLRVAVAFWGDACHAKLSTTLVVVSEVVVGTASQKHVER